MTDVYDLTTAFDLVRSFAPAPVSSSAGEEEGGAEGSEGSHDSESSAQAVGDEAAGEGHDQDEDVKDPDKKKLSEEAAKWRHKFREAEDRIKKLEDAHGAEALQASNRELRLRLAFERAGRDFKDMEAAWLLAQEELATVKFGDDGTPDASRISEIVGRVGSKYPYLVEAADAQPDPSSSPSGAGASSGSPMNGKRKSDSGTSAQILQKKFPALRGIRR